MQQQSRERGVEIDERGDVLAAPGGRPRHADQQRDAHQGVGQKLAVGEPVIVLAQRLAVVGREHHDGLLEKLALDEGVEQMTDLLVEVGDLGVVAGAIEGDLALLTTDNPIANGARVT